MGKNNLTLSGAVFSNREDILKTAIKNLRKTSTDKWLLCPLNKTLTLANIEGS
jgi:hypothetical protein